MFAPVGSPTPIGMPGSGTPVASSTHMPLIIGIAYPQYGRRPGYVAFCPPMS